MKIYVTLRLSELLHSHVTTWMLLLGLLGVLFLFAVGR